MNGDVVVRVGVGDGEGRMQGGSAFKRDFKIKYEWSENRSSTLLFKMNSGLRL